MRAIAVSDVHLGWGGSNPSFLDFLDWVSLQRPDFFILAGDIFELWRRDLSGALLEHWKFLSKISNLSERVEVVLIAGNHDWHLLESRRTKGDVYPYPELFRVAETFEITVQDRTYKFLHGHQFDPKCSNKRVNESLCHSNDNQGKAMSDGWDRRGVVGGLPITIPNSIYFNSFSVPPRYLTTLEYVAHPGFLKNRPKELQRIESRVEKERDENEYVVYGHTHSPFVGNARANTGSWTEGNSDFLDIVDLDVNLKGW